MCDGVGEMSERVRKSRFVFVWVRVFVHVDAHGVEHTPGSDKRRRRI